MYYLYNSEHVLVKLGTAEEIIKLLSPKKKKGVYCWTLQKIYKNAAECSMQLGVDPSQLRKHLQRLPGYRNVKGMQFSYLDSEEFRKTFPKTEII